MQTVYVTSAMLFVVTIVVSVNGDGQRHCGRQLTDMMHFVCNGKFKGLFDKRSGVSEITVGQLIDEHHVEQRPFYETFPFVWKAMRMEQLAEEQVADRLSNKLLVVATSGEHRVRRSSSAKLDSYLEQNIVKVCCDNPCTMSQMLDYCRV